MRTANRKKPLPHNLCSFTSSLCTCPAISASIQCIFSIYGLVCSNIRISLDAEKAEKSVKICRFYRAEEDNQQKLLKMFELFLSFFKSIKFRCYSFCFIKKQFTVKCTSVLLILLLSISTFFKGKVEWDFGGFYFLFLNKWAFKKRVIYFGWVQLHLH